MLAGFIFSPHVKDRSSLCRFFHPHCTSKSNQSGASVGPGRAGANSLLRHRKREQLLVTPQPLLCHPPPHPPPPPSGRGAPHPVSQSELGSTFPSHHLSFQGNRAPHALSLSLYSSPSVSIRKGAASSSSSLPSIHPAVPF